MASRGGVVQVFDRLLGLRQTALERMSKLLPILFILALFCASAFAFHQEREYVRGFVEAPAEIVELRSRRVTRVDRRQYSTDAHAVVAYRIDGQPHRFRTQFFGVPKWRRGQAVVALVSPTVSDVGRVKRLDDLFPRSAGLAALALLCGLALGVGRLARGLGPRPDNPSKPTPLRGAASHRHQGSR